MKQRTISWNEEQSKIIKKAAKKIGLSTSAFFRSAALEKARKIFRGENKK